jgi:hypothetical protein
LAKHQELDDRLGLNQCWSSGTDGITTLNHQSLVPSPIEPDSPKSRTYLVGFILAHLVFAVISLLVSPVENSQTTQEQVHQNREKLILMAY